MARAVPLPPSSSSLPTSPHKLQTLFTFSKLHSFLNIKPKFADTRFSTCLCKASQPEGVAEDPNVTEISSARTQLDLLEQLTSSGPSSISGYEGESSEIQRLTIREQLSELFGESGGEFTIPLGKRLKKNTLTISKRRNIKRQALLNKVSGRNDSTFFATVGAFVILPPIVILAVAILTGYVQLFP